jgi:hypothetical protein
MAAFNKVNVFTKDKLNAVHNFSSHTFKALLTNTAPTASGTSVKGDLTEISAGNGYSAGGPAVTMSVSTSSGTAKVTATDVTITAAGGSIGPFRYVAIYNDTQTTPAKPVVGWYDYGSSITLADGESLLIDFDGTNGFITDV